MKSKALSDRQLDILEELYKLKAFDQDHRRTTNDITEAVCGHGHGTQASFKLPVADLAHRGLVHTMGGAGGGVWLSAAGKTHISEARHLR